MIRVTIEFDHYDGKIEVVRDSSLIPDYQAACAPSESLQKIVACAEASAIAAMKAHPQR